MNQMSFAELSSKFLAWSKIHQEPRSTEYYQNYIKIFLAHLGDSANNPAEAMKPFQIEEWTDSHHETWGNNYKRGAVVAINRVFNWGTKSGHIDVNPIKTAFKPPAERRKTYMKPEDYNLILSHLKPTDPFYDLLAFVWIVGCRPQEVRHIEPRHVNLEKSYIIFPKEESKGKRHPRKILMNEAAQEIVTRLMGDRKEGKAFLNTRGEPWTKYSICNRMHRLSKITGIRMFMYAARHGYATRKLKAKHGHLEIAATLGHVDGSMLAKVYSHIEDDDDHLRTVLVD